MGCAVFHVCRRGRRRRQKHCCAAFTWLQLETFGTLKGWLAGYSFRTLFNIVAMNRASFPRSFFVLTALVMAAASQASQAACRVQSLPEGWAADAVRWEGACQGEKADGLGILKELQGTSVKRMFLGRASQGEMLLGVIEEPNQGFIAGHFQHGKVLATDERWPAISGFEEAAKAASESADRFDAAGNKASAKFYRDKAVLLRQQMD